MLMRSHAKSSSGLLQELYRRGVIYSAHRRWRPPADRRDTSLTLPVSAAHPRSSSNILNIGRPNFVRRSIDCVELSAVYWSPSGIHDVTCAHNCRWLYAHTRWTVGTQLSRRKKPSSCRDRAATHDVLGCCQECKRSSVTSFVFVIVGFFFCEWLAVDNGHLTNRPMLTL